MKESNFYNHLGSKAGMEEVDKECVDKIIHEASQNTSFYKRQQKRSEKQTLEIASRNLRIQSEKSKGKAHLTAIQSQILKIWGEVESENRTSETWIHIDMDMFYASVEIRDNPELADKPMAVGGERMLATANYIARKYGVRGSMPGFIAKKLCPDLILIKPNYEKYQIESNKLMELFREFDPEFERTGLDEAYLLVSHLVTGKRNGEGIAQEIRDLIYQRTGLTASAGVSYNKLLAKIASDISKPNGQFCIYPSGALDFLKEKDIRILPGIGKKIETELNKLEIYNCGDILTKKIDIFLGFPENTFRFLMKSALGIGQSQHSITPDSQKSTSVCLTIPPTNDCSYIEGLLEEFVNKLVKELSEREVSVKTITVYVKYPTFDCVSRSNSLKKYVNTYGDIFPVVLALLRMMYPIEPIRHVGIRLSNFICNSRKTSILNFANRSNRRDVQHEIQRDAETDESVCLQMCNVCKQQFLVKLGQFSKHQTHCTGSLKRKILISSFKKGKKQPKGVPTIDQFVKK